MEIRFPWDAPPKPAERPPPAPPVTVPRGRRPKPVAPVGGTPPWLYHHLTVSGPAAELRGFAAAARGPGVIPWELDFRIIEEDIFNLAVAQPASRRNLSIQGCRILARQFRERVEARQAAAARRIGRSLACPFDLQVLLPVPPAILALGPSDPAALAWLSRHWGTPDPPRQVVERPNPSTGRRRPRDHAIISYGFFTAGATPDAAVAALAERWPRLRFQLRPRPAG
jgi:hypothetical protein